MSTTSQTDFGYTDQREVDETNQDYFHKLAKATGPPEAPMKQEWIRTAAIMLSRKLPF